MSCTKSLQLKVQCLQWLVVVHLTLHPVAYSSLSCPSGLEYDCKSLLGNGTACVSGCNTTVTQRLSPGYCLDDCCKYCYSNCQECFYAKILSFCFHGSTNSSSKLMDKTSNQFETLDQDLRTSLLDFLAVSDQTVFKIELLQVKWCSKSHKIIQAYVRLTSREKTTEIGAINMIRNATKTGRLGGLIVSPDVFDVMTEKDYDLLNSKEEDEEGNLDVAELIAACIGALIIIAAVCWCLFYMCTTSHQRDRCNPCHRTRIDA